MANVDSDIGYATGTLVDSTPPGYVDSLIGYTTSSLSNPAAADSLIGYKSATIVDPTGRSDSIIGYTVGSLTEPVLPLLVLTGSGWERIPLLSLDSGGHWT